MAPETEPTVCIATVVAVHGVKGQVKARLEVDPAELPDTVGPVTLVDAHGRAFPAQLTEFRHIAQGVLLHVAGYHTPEAALVLKGIEVHLPETELYELEVDDEGPDLPLPAVEGYRVIDAVHGLLGEVVAVEPRADQPLLLIAAEGRPGVEILLPWHPEIVVTQDADAQTLRVNAPPGLIELYLTGA